MPPLPLEGGKVEREQPVSEFDTQDAILAALDKLFDTGKMQTIAEGRRIEFFEGKRKVKDGTTKKTGHHYWQWVYKSPDTGNRKRPYGGAIETVPASYQYRRRQYEARFSHGGAESLADALFRPSLSEMRNGDTGAG